MEEIAQGSTKGIQSYEFPTGVAALPADVKGRRLAELADALMNAQMPQDCGGNDVQVIRRRQLKPLVRPATGDDVHDLPYFFGDTIDSDAAANTFLALRPAGSFFVRSNVHDKHEVDHSAVNAKVEERFQRCYGVGQGDISWLQKQQEIGVNPTWAVVELTNNDGLTATEAGLAAAMQNLTTKRYVYEKVFPKLFNSDKGLRRWFRPTVNIEPTAPGDVERGTYKGTPFKLANDSQKGLFRYFEDPEDALGKIKVSSASDDGMPPAKFNLTGVHKMFRLVLADRISIPLSGTGEHQTTDTARLQPTIRLLEPPVKKLGKGTIVLLGPQALFKV